MSFLPNFIAAVHANLPNGSSLPCHVDDNVFALSLIRKTDCQTESFFILDSYQGNRPLKNL